MAQKKKDAYFYPCESEKEIIDGEYELSSPVDFYEWSKLIAAKTATTRHHDEFDLRVIKHYMDKIYNDELPEKWVMLAIANAFMKIVNGGRWEDEFQLPWTHRSSPFSPAETKDLEIFCKIANKLNENPELSITKLIEEVSSQSAVSYEKARAAYYEYKKHLK